MKWCPAITALTWWVTVSLPDEILSNVEVTIATSIMKWCPARLVFTWWVTVFLSDEILSNVEVTTATSIVKWCIAISVLTWWVTVSLSDEVLSNDEVTMATSIVKWCLTSLSGVETTGTGGVPSVISVLNHCTSALLSLETHLTWTYVVEPLPSMVPICTSGIVTVCAIANN